MHIQASDFLAYFIGREGGGGGLTSKTRLLDYTSDLALLPFDL